MHKKGINLNTLIESMHTISVFEVENRDILYIC